MTTTHHEELAKQTADIIKEYWQTEYSRYRDTHFIGAVYDLYNNTQCCSDNLCNYELYMRYMLEAMGKPDVSKVLEKHLGASLQDDIVTMFSSLLYFFRRMEGDRFRLQLDAYDIENYGDYSEEWLLEKQIEFKAKLAGLKAQAKEEERLRREAKLKAA